MRQEAEALKAKLAESHAANAKSREQLELLVHFPDQFQSVRLATIPESSASHSSVTSESRVASSESPLENLLRDLQGQIGANCFRIEQLQRHNHQLQRAAIRLLHRHGRDKK